MGFETLGYQRVTLGFELHEQQPYSFALNLLMQVRVAQRVAQPARLCNIIFGPLCCASARLHAMPSKVLVSARPETYTQQIGEKRKRIENMFASFNPPELRVFESKTEHYRMR